MERRKEGRKSNEGGREKDKEKKNREERTLKENWKMEKKIKQK